MGLQDYTLFEPANGPYSITDPTKWQPLVIEPVPPYSGGGATALTGAPYVQHHITPQVLYYVPSKLLASFPQPLAFTPSLEAVADAELHASMGRRTSRCQQVSLTYAL